METSTSSPVPAQRITKETKALLRLSRSSSIPLIDLRLIDVEERVLSCIPPMLALELLVLPVYVKSGRNGSLTLYVAVCHPRCDEALQRLEAVTGLVVRPLLADSSDILAAILDYYNVSIPCSPCGSGALEPTATALTDNGEENDRRDSAASAA